MLACGPTKYSTKTHFLWMENVLFTLKKANCPLFFRIRNHYYRYAIYDVTTIYNNKEYFSKEHFSKKYTIQYNFACDDEITPYYPGCFISNLSSINYIM